MISVTYTVQRKQGQAKGKKKGAGVILLQQRKLVRKSMRRDRLQQQECGHCGGGWEI
jgi:hypothetical protein